MIYLRTGNYIFSNTLTSGTGSFDKAMIGETLSADAMDFTLLISGGDLGRLEDVNDVDLDDANSVELYSLGDDATINEADFVHGQVVTLQTGMDLNDGLIASLRLDYLERTGKYTYVLHCVSTVGFLADKQHLGGMFTGESVKNILADILGATYSSTSGSYYLYNVYENGSLVFTYYISHELGDITLTGWLPVASQRDNLIQLLFATGGSLLTRSGQLYFEFVVAQARRSIPSSDLYIGSNVINGDNVTDCILTEHAFIVDGTLDPETLYEDLSLSVTDYLVTFNGPYHTLTASGGLTINDSGCNYAVVTGLGTLTGIPYVHTTIDLSASTGLSGLKKEASAKDMTDRKSVV